MSGSGNTLESIYNNLNNPAYLSKDGDTYTLNKDIFVNYGGTLSIENSKLIFGSDPARPSKPVRIWNMGSLQIKGSTLTSASSNNALWGYIECKTFYGSQPWKFNMTNSTLSNLGPIANSNPYIDEYGNAAQSIYLFGEGTYGTQCNTPVIISNNKFTGTNGLIAGGTLNFYNNYITQSTANSVFMNTGGGAYIHDNTWENNNFYKAIINWGAGRITGNTFKNNTGSICVGLKEGNGGSNISGNIFDGGSFDYTLMLSGSGHTKWSVANNNVIKNISGGGKSNIGLCVQGNGYDDPNTPEGPQSMVAVSAENNTIKNVGIGIRLMGIGNFGANFGPQEVLTRNNVVDGCVYGYQFYNAVNTKNVTLVGDSLKNCSGADIYISAIQTASDVQPKIVDLKYVTKNKHLMMDNGGRYFEYKTLNWTAASGSTATVTNNVNSAYPVIYYNDAVASPFVLPLGKPVIMLVKKGVASGGAISYQNMNYDVQVGDTHIAAYDPSVGTSTAFSGADEPEVPPEENNTTVEPPMENNTTIIPPENNTTVPVNKDAFFVVLIPNSGSGNWTISDGVNVTQIEPVYLSGGNYTVVVKDGTLEKEYVLKKGN